MAPYEVIAHRAGNDPVSLREVAAHADLVEADLHLWRGRLEVRHAKRAWPTSRLWERDGLVARGTPVNDFAGVLDEAAASDAALWLDLKGVDPRLFRRADAATRGLGRCTVSTKSWWLLAPFSRRADVRTFRSAGNRLELWLVRRVPSRLAIEGVVLHERLVDAALAAELRARGWRIVCWAVTDRRRADELAGWGVEGFIVDDRELIVELSQRRG